MRTFKYVVALFLTVCILCTSASAVSAAETLVPIEDSTFQITGETLALSPSAYVQKAMSVTKNMRCSDNVKIEAVCQTFLSMIHASVRNQAYDCTWLIAQDSMDAPTIQYRLSEFAFQNALNDTKNVEITQDKISFHSFKANISNDTAVASIVEEYVYYLDEGFDDDYNYRMREYTFSLSKDSGNQWKITKVITNDPWETEDFAYTSIDVETAVKTMLAPVKDEQILDKQTAVCSTDSVTVAPQYDLRSYSPQKAIEYAETWYNKTNSVFGSSGSNCQNFASQCVWAGLHGGNTLPSQRTAWPALPTSVVGTSAANVWCRNQSTTYYSEYYFNWAWDNVGGFAKLIQTSNALRRGPIGTVSTGLSNVEAGDVIAYDTGGSPAANTVDHAMFVTSVSGSKGSRGTANVKIAANTSPTNSAYQSLNTYSTYAANYYLTVHIKGTMVEHDSGERV